MAQNVAVVAGAEVIPSIVAPVRVEIFSDLVCPWCFIGKRRFETAISRLRQRGIDITLDYQFMPFQLDPTAPTDSAIPVIEAYAKKFGGRDKAIDILNHVTKVAAQDGITFNMDIAVRANTLNAHRLLTLAHSDYGVNTQIALKEIVMRAYFTDGQNIADVEVLTACAGEAGMNTSEVLEFLAGPRLIAETNAAIAAAQDVGVTAVPTFVINGQWSIPGAQDVDMFERILERLHNQS